MSFNNRNLNFYINKKYGFDSERNFFVCTFQEGREVAKSTIRPDVKTNTKKYEIDNELWNDRLSTKELTVTRIKSNAIVGIMVNCCSTTDRLRIQK